MNLTLELPTAKPAIGETLVAVIAATTVAVQRAWHRRKLATLSDRQLRDAGIDLSAAGRGKAAAVSAATLWRLQALTHG